MSAFFFGSSASPLFGFHHAPRSEAVGAVLICPPWGREYQYAHRALRVLAKRLADRDLHVLRFDYRGTGDSWGDTTDGHVSAWMDDIECAAEELRALSGCHETHLVGLRLGALLAASVSARGEGFGKVVLWDPIIRGEEWLGSLKRPVPLQTQMQTATLELDGQLVAETLAYELREVSIARVTTELAAVHPPRRQMLVLETQEPSAALHDTLAAMQNLDLRHVEDEAPWREDPSIWSGLVPVKAISTMIAWITA